MRAERSINIICQRPKMPKRSEGWHRQVIIRALSELRRHNSRQSEMRSESLTTTRWKMYMHFFIMKERNWSIRLLRMMRSMSGNGRMIFIRRVFLIKVFLRYLANEGNVYVQNPRRSLRTGINCLLFHTNMRNHWYWCIVHNMSQSVRILQFWTGERVCSAIMNILEKWTM